MSAGGAAEGEGREELLPDGEGQDRHLLGGHQAGARYSIHSQYRPDPWNKGCVAEPDRT